MAKVNITEAAKLAGITRQYLHKKYINTGKITVEKDEEGKNPQIDTAEIARVFGKISDNSNDSNSYRQTTPENDSKNTALQAENQLLRELLKAKEDHISDLQQSLRLLEHKAAPEPSKKRRWWQFS
jgi:predicted RNase H-like nuclease (RuvC/YqgF family)